MDNNEDYFQTSLLNEDSSQTNRKKIQFLQRKICTKFQPYKEYFRSVPIARILSSTPYFKPTISNNLRNNLKIPRQIQYLKASVQHDYCEEALQELLKEQEYQPIRKFKNTSVMDEGTYYWAHQTKIKSAQISDFITKSKLQPNKEVWSVSTVIPTLLMDLNEWIYQISAQDHILYVRTSRSLYSIDPKQKKVISKHLFGSQLINYQICQQKILFSTYQKPYSSLYEQRNQQQTNLHLWCRIDGLINSLWQITESQIFVCKENALLIADRRKKGVSQLYKRPQAFMNRIYSGLPLENTKFGPRYFLASESFSVNIYDIRKVHQPVLKIPHYCEESPPSILQTFTSQKQQKLDSLHNFQQFFGEAIKLQNQNPLLIAHSPYENGSSLLTQLSIDWQSPKERLKRQFIGEINQFKNKFQLLFDTGKTTPNYHPLSVNPISLGSQIGFLHLDNFYGLSFQILDKIPINHNMKGYKVQKNLNRIYQRIDFMKHQGIQDISNSNHQWFRSHTIQKQLQPENTQFWSDRMIDEESLQLQSNTFEQKNVRYADLSKFYHQISEKSKPQQLHRKIKEEETAILRQIELTKHKPLMTQQTQSPSQREDNNRIIGDISEEGFQQLLEEWISL